MIVRLTKLKEAENPLHPNNIEEGHVVEGELLQYPKVGGYFSLVHESRLWSTSQIQEIISDNIFRTFNSIYEWEIVKIEDDEIEYCKLVLRHAGIVII